VDHQLGCGQTEVPASPTYEQLLKLVAELQAQLKEATALIQAQAKKIRQLEEENRILKKKLYGSSSERGKNRSRTGSNGSSAPKNPSKQSRVRALSEQYPHTEVEEQYIDFENAPQCQCCHGTMIDSGLGEVTEQLHTVPARHKIIRQYRRKYKCPRCYTGLVTARQLPRIAPGSSLGDSFIIEAATAKFYYLIPAQRYALMAAQSGLEQFPPQLVLAAHHYLAEFLRPVYGLLQRRIQRSHLLFADETPHRMLEGSESKNWFLWGFSAEGVCYFEIHDTRSGDVAIEFLAASDCIYLMSDVYAGYTRAIREVNAIRRTRGLREIIPLFCNSHSRRKFVEASINYPEEAQFFIDQYETAYRLEAELKLLKDPQSRSEKRAEMRPFFEAMLVMGKTIRDRYSDKSSIVRAIDYYTNNYEGLTRFLENPDLPIDNNLSERHLRNPVIGRKTWYGTHSERGVETTEILFTIMQSCKHLKIDPRQYLQALTESMLMRGPPFTPSQYLDSFPDGKVA
jgi:transposase